MGGMSENMFSTAELTFKEKIWRISWSFVLMVVALGGVGFVMLVSAANGAWDPWAARQAPRFALGLLGLLVLATTDVRIWMRYAYWIYAITLILLIGVEIRGYIGMGAQRWISLGFMNIQPSEVMKVAVVLALARHYHSLTFEDVQRPFTLIIPTILIAMPMALVLRQPDLGTAMMLAIAGGTILLVAGVPRWVFGAVIGLGLLAIPVGWQFLHDYQRERVLTFLDPARDPLGAGYHITQSKITLGSGGMFGKGFMQGTQSHLNFLPEKQTDFIFTMLAEEFGMVGGLGLLGLYTLLLGFGLIIALRSRSHFGRLLAVGLTTNLFLYVFINIAMVMGLIPVVGVPLPLVSYGGTALMTAMASFGLILSVHVHKDIHVGRRGSLRE